MPAPDRAITANLVMAAPGDTYAARFSFGCRVTGGDVVEVRVGGETFSYQIPRSSVWVSMTPITLPEPAVVDDGVPTEGGG